jgi:hypothetical protein
MAMTSITEPFREAREILGVGVDCDAAAIKRAWRKAAAESPPDRDPERFRQVRQAYELLTDPMDRAVHMLSHPVPFVPPPALPEPPAAASRHSFVVQLLRSIVGRLPIDDLRPPERSARGSQPPRRES